MDTTHWADWADTFKLQDAACLIAGVSPAKEMVAWADKLPPEARPAFKKLWDSYMRGTGAYKRPESDSADFPKMLYGIPSEDFQAPTSVPARGAIRRPEMLVPPSAELMRTRLESVRVSREELHRWVKAAGIKSAYSFAPVATAPEQGTAPAQTAPAHMVAASDGPAQTAAPAPEVADARAPGKKLPVWLTQNIDYLARINREHKCSSAQDLFNKLESLGAKDNNDVQKGAGRDRDKLYFVNACTAVTLSTFRKYLPEIRAH